MRTVYALQGSSDTFVKGIALVLWDGAWADHCEEHDCYNLSGCKIEDHMPPIPEIAWRMAERIAGHIEGKCGSLAVLFSQALKADDPTKELEHEDYHGELAERFGECLCYMAQGAGVSWFDDHEEFPLDVPLCADDLAFELMMHAGDKCEEESDSGKVRHSCGGYEDADAKKCSHCSEAIDPTPPVTPCRSPVLHWEHGGRPFCGAAGGAMVAPEEDVTCERCLARIGCQDSPGGGGS